MQTDIRIGTMIGAGPNTAAHMKYVLPYGFESFEITLGQSLNGIHLDQLAAETREALEGSGAVISCLGIYGNPLGVTPIDEETRQAWEHSIDAAALFGCNLVCGFAGRVVNVPIDQSIPRFKEVFGPLASRAADQGVRIAFENCEMGGTWASGDWNIALCPQCWEMLFDALPMDNLGLEWEPCHQMVKLIDPMPQLRKWAGRIFHLHGKDATVMWDVIREHGIIGPKPFAFNRTPGFGDSNWRDIITELRMAGFKGSIDIEGYHDPVYREDLETTGQIHALNYLKWCRGGEYVANPVF